VITNYYESTNWKLKIEKYLKYQLLKQPLSCVHLLQMLTSAKTQLSTHVNRCVTTFWVPLRVVVTQGILSIHRTIQHAMVS